MSEVTELNEVFKGYKVKAECISYEKTNNFKVFYIKLKPGCKVKTLENISTEIQIGLRLLSAPVFTPAPELGLIKMVSIQKAGKINVKDIIDYNDKRFNAYVGVDSDGGPVVLDFNENPHLLVAGSTGSGKSVFLHTIINNLINRKYANKIDLFLIDPKMVEFERYKTTKFLGHVSVVSSYEDAMKKLFTIHNIMDKRYKLLSKFNCNSVEGFNKKYKSKFSKIVCIIDEFADLIIRDSRNGHKMETLICSIAAKSRAAGIHLILATQRPSVKIITGLIKANFPARSCFKVSSNVDSRVILDCKGGESLNGKGDGILSGHSDNKKIRFQSAM